MASEGTPLYCPGVEATSEQKAKDERRFAKAYDLIAEDFENEEKIPNTSNSVGSVTLQECARRIAPFDECFLARAMMIQELHFENVELLLEAVKQSKTLIRDIKTKMVELDIHDKGFVPEYLLTTVGNYPFILEPLRLWQAETNTCTKYQKKIVKCTTEAIRISEIHYAGPGMKGPKTAFTIKMLCQRGRMQYDLGRFEEARADFRAVCSGIRLLGDDWTSQPTFEHSSEWYILSACRLKIETKARPHFSAKEQSFLHKMVGLGVYEASNFRCGNCLQKQSDHVELKRCTSCMHCWYCSKECQVAAWKQHKTECKKMAKPFDLKDGCLSTAAFKHIADEIDKDVVSHVGRSVYGPVVFAYDKEKGEYYDCLSDATLPSCYVRP